jgi:hypothetical protein
MPAAASSSAMFADVNGDGIDDLIVAPSVGIDQINIPGLLINYLHATSPRVRPGDGRGHYGCDVTGTIDNDTALACQEAITEQNAFDPSWAAPGYRINVPAGPPPWNIPSKIAAMQVHPGYRYSYVFHDVTGDGLADIVQYDGGGPTDNVVDNFPLSFFGDGRVRLWVNTDGNHFECADPANECIVATITDPVWPDVGPPSPYIFPFRTYFNDIDGNGTDDLVIVAKVGVFHVSFGGTAALAALPRVGGDASRPGLLTRIDNGHGAITEINYATIQELDASLRAASTPWNTHSPIGGSVVQNIKTHSADTSIPFTYQFSRSDNFIYTCPARHFVSS